MLIKSQPYHGNFRAVSKSIPTGTFYAKHGANLARLDLIHVFQLVGVHPDQSRYFAAFSRTSIHKPCSPRQDALVYADVGELTVAAFFKLECQTDKRGVRVVAKRNRDFLGLFDLERCIRDL